VHIAVFSRALVPSHFFQRKVLAWRCSVCRKLFCRSLDEVACVGGDNPPIYIEREFRMHNCELVLVSRQEWRDESARCDFRSSFGKRRAATARRMTKGGER
jgi:hypothetical protein